MCSGRVYLGHSGIILGVSNVGLLLPDLDVTSLGLATLLACFLR
jgi:hypothetical protein